MSQTGTRALARRRSPARGVVCFALLIGCAQDDTGTGAPQPGVGDKDAEAQIPQKDDASVTHHACAEHAAAITKFVSTHAACTTDSDCVIVGDCRHADFQSVAKSAADEARALVLGNPCGAQDGPTYNAVCRANKCGRAPSGESCGQPPQTACPDGTAMREPGCSVSASDAKFAKGCYASCTDDSACAPGYACQVTTVHPCVPAPGTNSSCDACGAHDTRLCLPAPDCEVELALTFGSSRTVAKVPAGASTELKLWLNNRTDRALTLAFDVPCHGPRIEGLGGYDVWSGCVAGACATDPVRTTVTLAPGEKLPWRGAVLSGAPSTCNAAGLPDGRHALSFALPGLTGAKLCGTAPVTLLSGSAAN